MQFFLLILLTFFVSLYSEGSLKELSSQNSFIEIGVVRAPRPSTTEGGFIGLAGLFTTTPSITEIENIVFNSGFIQGPIASTIDAVPRFANTTGNLLKNSLVLVDDAGNITINGITKNGNTVSWPSIVGAAGTFLGSDGVGNLIYSTPVGSGNVSTALPLSPLMMLLLP